MNVEEYNSHHSKGDDDCDTVEEYNSHHLLLEMMTVIL